MDLAYPEFRKPRPGHSKCSWGFQRASSGFMYHCIEFTDPQDLRIAWALAVQREDGWLEVEELFVRPTFRRKGYRKGVLRSLKELADGLDCGLKIWISHADTAASNIAVIKKLIKPLGLSINASGQRWAPLLASHSDKRDTEQQGKAPPCARPRSPFGPKGSRPRTDSRPQGWDPGRSVMKSAHPASTLPHLNLDNSPLKS